MICVAQAKPTTIDKDAASGDVQGLPRKKVSDPGTGELGAAVKDWVEPMRQVHLRFSGKPGTLAQIGDSITFSGAYWSPLAARPKNMSEAVEAKYEKVKKHLKPECLNQKGPSFGNQGSMTIRWARDNISNWLAK